MADAELLRLDYVQTAPILRELAEVRFKLLAFVPTVSGAAIAFLRHPGSAAELLGVGLVGLIATAGLLVYDLRNSQLYRGALERATFLEHRLGMISITGEEVPGGPFSERAPVDRKVAGVFSLAHGAGLSAVYCAAIGGWSYLVGWGALRAAHASHPRSWGAAVAVAAAFATLAEAQRLLTRPTPVEAPSAQASARRA
jgi:hypothetical protein